MTRPRKPDKITVFTTSFSITKQDSEIINDTAAWLYTKHRRQFSRSEVISIAIKMLEQLRKVESSRTAPSTKEIADQAMRSVAVLPSTGYPAALRRSFGLDEPTVPQKKARKKKASRARR